MSVEESLWSLRLPNGDVRSGTIEQLEEAFRAGHIAGSSPVLPPGGREWVALDAIAGRGQPVSVKPAAVAPVVSSPAVVTVRPSGSPPPAASQPPRSDAPAHSDIWQVRLASGEVRSGTRQQLAEAFRAGHIDGGALALPAGAREWTRLDSVLRTSPPVSHPVAPVAVQPPRAEDVDDLCHVKVSRAKLEEAFRAGFLDESILVLTSEASDWVKLGSLVDRRAAPPSTPRYASVNQTGEWPPSETGVLAGDASPAWPPAPQTEPALDASGSEGPVSQPMHNENGVADARLSDDETPSTPGLS